MNPMRRAQRDAAILIDGTGLETPSSRSRGPAILPWGAIAHASRRDARGEKAEDSAEC